MRKISIIGSLLITLFLISGCAVSDYITGADEDKTYSLLTEDEEDSSDVEELDDLIEELEGIDEEEETEDEAEDEDIIDDDVADEEEADEEVEEEENEEEAEDVTESTPIQITVDEGEVVNLKPKAKDADDDKIIYTFSEPLSASGRWETTYGDAGEYLITVTASDGKLTTARKVLLVVNKLNVAPEITGVSGKIEVEEGDTLSLDPKATDPNGDDVTLTISEPVGDDGKWEIGYQDAGEYTVEITASDGEKETVKEVEVVVAKKNIAPIIEGIEDSIEVDEGETVTLSPEVSDLNGDEVTVTISDPIGDDGEWATDYTDHGKYTVIVKATDGTATTSKEVVITVNDVNVAPVIEDILQS